MGAERQSQAKTNGAEQAVCSTPSLKRSRDSFQTTVPGHAKTRLNPQPQAQISPSKPMFRGLSHELMLPSSDLIVQPQLSNGSAEPNQAKEAKTSNQTGLSDHLKAGVENLSGYSLGNVRVHYNSPKPAQLRALAYTQGTEIHVAPGQEKHLSHEAWHVVQQKQGRVKPTEKKQGIDINAEEGLEREADVMGRIATALTEIKTETLKDRHIVQDVAQGIFINSSDGDAELEENVVLSLQKVLSKKSQALANEFIQMHQQPVKHDIGAFFKKHDINIDPRELSKGRGLATSPQFGSNIIKGEGSHHLPTELIWLIRILNKEVLKRMNQDERKLVLWVYKSVTYQQFLEMCHGGQVRIPFDELVFKELTTTFKAEQRRSSHYTGGIIPTTMRQVPDNHYGIDGQFIPTLLFGEIQDSVGKRYIYLQFEANSYNPSAGIWEKIRHVFDAGRYAHTQKNQGPYGVSAYTDRQPMGAEKNEEPTIWDKYHPLRVIMTTPLEVVYHLERIVELSIKNPGIAVALLATPPIYYLLKMWGTPPKL
jgi:hypothetical protein